MTRFLFKCIIGDAKELSLTTKVCPMSPIIAEVNHIRLLRFSILFFDCSGFVVGQNGETPFVPLVGNRCKLLNLFQGFAVTGPQQKGLFHALFCLCHQFSDFYLVLISIHCVLIHSHCQANFVIDILRFHCTVCHVRRI